MSEEAGVPQSVAPGEWCGVHGKPSELCMGPHAQYIDDAHGNRIVTMPVRNPRQVQRFQEASRKPQFRMNVGPHIHRGLAQMLVILTAELPAAEAFAYLRAHVASIEAEYNALPTEGEATT